MICFTFQKLLNLLFVLMLYFVGLNAQADEITFYHYDGMGNPIAATDMQGNVVWKERYSPSGEPLLNQPAKEGHNIGYKGHVYDKELGLVYMAHRYYDPKVGRFLSNDPVGFTPSNVQSFNRYAYANNNPYKYWDPDGLYADLIVESVSIGLGLKSFWDNYYQGNYGAAAVDAFGVAADTALAAVPFLPGGVGLGIQSVRQGSNYGIGKLSNVVANKAPSIQDQALDLKKLNNNKNTVTVESGSKRTHFDLDGATHKGVKTPHKQYSYPNTSPKGETVSESKGALV